MFRKNNANRNSNSIIYDEFIRFAERNPKNNRWKMIEKNCKDGEFERGLNVYLWDLLTKTKPCVWYHEIDGGLILRENDDGFLSGYDKCEAIQDYDRLFTEKKRDMLELIAKLVTGCLYYLLKDLVSQGKNVIFSISTKEKKCKELIDLIFINNNMIKKLLSCATIMPHCNMINWYEKNNNTLIVSKSDLLANSNNQDVTLLKLFIKQDVKC